MRRIPWLSTTLSLSSAIALFAGSAVAATPATIRPTITSAIPLPNSDDDIAQITSAGSSWVIIGNVEKQTIPASPLLPIEPSLGGSDGYLALLDSSLHLVWSHRFGTPNDDIATAVVRDSTGVIWGVGVTTKPAEPNPTATLAPSSPPISTPAPTVNPDGVLPVTAPAAPAIADQLLVSAWSSDGSLLHQYLQPVAVGVSLLPTSVLADKYGIYVVGTAVDANAATSRGFYLHVDRDGTFGSVRWLGSEDVKLSSAVLLSRGSLVVAGSIAENLKGRPAIGLADAYLAILNPATGAVLRTVRTGKKGATASWESVTADRAGNIFVVGSSQIGRKSEAVATAFNAAGGIRFSRTFASPLGSQLALAPPKGAFAAIALTNSGKRGTESYLLPLSTGGVPLAPVRIAYRGGSGLLAGADGAGHLLATGTGTGVTLAWFSARVGK